MDKVRIGDICTVVSGSTPKSSIEEYWNGDIKWITPAEISADSYVINDTERHITEKAVEKTNLTLLPVGTVLLSSRAPIGKTAIVGAEMYCNQGFKNLICSERIYNKYLYFFLTSKVDYLNALGRGATFKEISKGIVEDVEIPLPSLESQKKIVERLESIERLINNRKQALLQLDTLVKSRFVEMFGDPVTNCKEYPVYKLSDITTSRLGKMLDKKRQTGDNKYPYLANYNVQWFRFELDNLNEMDFDEADRKEFELRNGDLLVCEGGEVGRCAIWRGNKENCYFQKALHRVRCNPQYIIPEYLGWTFYWHAQYNGFIDAISGVSTIAHLPGDKLKQLQIIVPPLELQNQFADFVAQADKSKLSIQQSIETLQTLKAKLMQEYFG